MFHGEGSYNWGGAAGSRSYRWQDPQLQNIDAETAALAYGALVNPASARAAMRAACGSAHGVARDHFPVPQCAALWNAFLVSMSLQRK
jgi:hypothetical protein